MEILFCDRCRESIPDADVESGKAVRVGGRVLHVPCAFRRAMPGPARTLTLLLALVGAAGAAYAVSRVSAKDEGRSTDAQLASQWRKDVGDGAARATQDVTKALADQRAAFEARLAQDAKARDDQMASLRLELEKTLAGLRGEVNAYTDGMTHRIESNDRRMAAVEAWVKEVRDLAARSAAAAPVVAPPGGATGPTPTGPTPAPGDPAPPPPGGVPPGMPGTAPATDRARDPEAQKRHDAEVDRWIERLKDPDNGLSFSATYKLKDLKDLRAVPPLIETLKLHKDYYTRLGAATALGELHACDAVAALVDALDDREDLVQTAAGEALTTITGRDSRIMVGLSKKERKQLKDEWARWWKDHEPEVRQRLNQPAPVK